MTRCTNDADYGLVEVGSMYQWAYWHSDRWLIQAQLEAIYQLSKRCDYLEALDRVQGLNSPLHIPRCDECGEELDYLPWHFSEIRNRLQYRDLRACDDCWPRVKRRMLTLLKTRNIGGIVAEAKAEALEEAARLIEAAPQRTPYGRIDMQAVAKIHRERAREYREGQEGPLMMPVRVTQEMIEAGAQRLVRWDDGCKWPDSWDALDVAAARSDAERVIRSALAVSGELSPEKHANTTVDDPVHGEN